jgi:hypothetical protein
VSVSESGKAFLLFDGQEPAFPSVAGRWRTTKADDSCVY